MVRSIYISIIVLCLAAQAWGQHQSFIGVSKDEVKELVSKNHKKFAFDNTVVKQQFNYLKYVNGPQTITWIFYFSDKDICTGTKKVIDYSEYDFVIQDLDDAYERIDKHQWKYKVDKKEYVITMEELDWYFTIREKERKK